MRLRPVPAWAGTLEGERGEKMAREALCERTAEGEPGRGSPSLGATEPQSKQWCVSACARVCSGGRGVPGVLQHQTAPRGGKRIRNDGTTADRTLNPCPLGASRGQPRLPAGLSCLSSLVPIQRPPRLQGPEFCPLPVHRPLRRQEPLCRLCGPTEGAWCCFAFGEAPLLREAGLSGGDVGDVMRHSCADFLAGEGSRGCPGLETRLEPLVSTLPCWPSGPVYTPALPCDTWPCGR